jgi:hypothetical protein
MGDLRPRVNPHLAPLPFGRLAGPVRARGVSKRGKPVSRRPAEDLHVLRAPLGGLFRHVVDVAHGQAERGHRVGLIVDSTTGGARAEAALAELAPRLALGIERVADHPRTQPRDIYAAWRISRRIKALAPDVLHGHGAKGAALARLTPSAPQRDPRLHAARRLAGLLSRHAQGGFYRSLEWLLNPRTDLFLFESSYVADLFRSR